MKNKTYHVFIREREKDRPRRCFRAVLLTRTAPITSWLWWYSVLMLLQALSLHLLPLFFSPDCHCYRQASTYPARFTISTLQQTPFLLYTNRLVQIKLPAPPANTAEGGKASLQPKCTVSMSEGLRTAPPSCFPVQQANLFVTSKLKAA